MTEPSIRIVSQTQSLELTVRQIRDQLFDAVIDDVSVLEEKRSGAGVRLGEILRLTATDGFTTVTMKSTDGFTGTLPFEIAKDGILIFELDGQSLPSKLGGPFRFFTIASAECGTAVADHCKNVKSIVEIELAL